jgi:ornithine carbamoyltransferase (EC 2.1.3.3)
MELTDDVMDGPQSAILDQSENRLYTIKAVLERFLS